MTFEPNPLPELSPNARRVLQARYLLRDAGRRVIETPAQHLERMAGAVSQSACQRHFDNSVSKTVNLPREATPQDVAGVFRRAWELGMKGITVYRYGSTGAQVPELGVVEEPHQYDHASRCDLEECRV